MDLEKTRLFVQQLFAPPNSDVATTVALLGCLRNAVIGNNKQKTNVIALGAVPRLLQVTVGCKFGKKLSQLVLLYTIYIVYNHSKDPLKGVTFLCSSVF